MARQDTQKSLFLSDVAVAARYDAHRSWTWRQVGRDPSFPRPIKLSGGMTRWRLADIESWEADKAGNSATDIA